MIDKKKFMEIYTPDFYNPYEDDFVIDYAQAEMKRVQKEKEGTHTKYKYPPSYKTYQEALDATKNKRGRVIEKIRGRYVVTEVW